jgi:hypothetical protein
VQHLEDGDIETGKYALKNAEYMHAICTKKLPKYVSGIASISCLILASRLQSLWFLFVNFIF